MFISSLSLNQLKPVGIGRLVETLEHIKSKLIITKISIPRTKSVIQTYHQAAPSHEQQKRQTCDVSISIFIVLKFDWFRSSEAVFIGVNASAANQVHKNSSLGLQHVGHDPRCTVPYEVRNQRDRERDRAGGEGKKATISPYLPETELAVPLNKYAYMYYHTFDTYIYDSMHLTYIFTTHFSVFLLLSFVLNLKAWTSVVFSFLSDLCLILYNTFIY